MHRRGFVPVVALLVVVGLLAIGGVWYFEAHRSVQFSQSATTVQPSSQIQCDVAAADFTDAPIDTDQFGQINFKNGNAVENDDSGNPDWSFTLSTSSSLYSFGSNAVRIINIFADHLGGSGSWYVAVGYACSGNQLKKVLEQSSLAPPVITQSGNTLSVTTWQTYEGAAPPQGKTTSQFKWMSDNLFSAQQSGCSCWDAGNSVCLPVTACE